MCSGAYKKLVMAGMDEGGGISVSKGGKRHEADKALCIVLRALELYRQRRAIEGCNGRSVCLGRLILDILWFA